MAISRLLARPLLGSIFFYAGYHAAKNPAPLAERARKMTDLVGSTAQRAGVPMPSDAETIVRINGAVQVAAASALALGKAPRISAMVLAASLAPTTVAGHAFWEETDPAARNGQKIQFAKNLSVLGGLLLAAVDTEGRPGVAWRARHAATDARRQARSLTRQAKLEARLAAKSIG